MTPGSRPFEPSFSADELHAASEEAHKHGRRVAVHALNAEAIRRSIAAGVDTIEHCLWNDRDGQPAFDVDAARDLVQRGLFVGVNLTGIDRILLSDRAPDAAVAAIRREKLRARWASARQMLAIGANVMLSSDAGTRYARFEDFGLTLACAVEALELTPIEAIHRATLVPARALGIDEEVGSVEIGKRADLLIVEGDPSQAIDDIQRIREVWRDGRCVAGADVIARPAEVSMLVPEADLT
jgi:imidazolonepropionase-like amidohydrolase